MREARQATHGYRVCKAVLNNLDGTNGAVVDSDANGNGPYLLRL